jgi:hypothetical protein
MRCIWPAHVRGVGVVRWDIEGVHAGVESIHVGVESVRWDIEGVRAGVESVCVGVESVRRSIEGKWTSMRTMGVRNHQ